MEKAKEFIVYALERANPKTILKSSTLPIPYTRVGTAVGAPWVYLWGTTGQLVTQALLNERYEHYYKNHGWSRDEFDRVTAGWVKEGRWATDCEGLLDSFLKKDVNADYCYNYWCTEKGAIKNINRPYQIGEAVFRSNSAGKMVHVGFVCGYLDNGDTLVVESRGIMYGVVVTKLSERGWTHRGLVTKQLEYSDDPTPSTKIIYNKVTSPMKTGEPYKAMQHALNLGGYGPLDEDGKWGKKSLAAFQDMMNTNR